MATETELALIFCTLLLGGEVEVRHDYIAAGEARHIRVDCETEARVYEIGFDARRSTLDSLHQALFAAEVIGKMPAILVIDTNGVEEAVEFQVRTVAARVGVEYQTITADWLLRWQMTAPFRDRAPPRAAGF